MVEILQVLFELFVAICQLLVALSPFFFLGLIFFMLARSFYMNRKLINRIRSEFPEVENPGARMEAIIRGIQRSGQL
jgi:hypothetical protein